MWLQTNTSRWIKHFAAILSNSITQLELISWWHWTKTAIQSPFFQAPLSLSSSAPWRNWSTYFCIISGFRVSLPPAVIDFQSRSQLFLHFDRLLCHIIGGFLGALALKVCPLLSALMRKWAALYWYVPEQMCTLIKISVLCLCLRALFQLLFSAE